MTATACTLLMSEAVVPVSGFQQTDLVAAMLLLVLGMALGIGLVCLLIVLHYMRTGRLSAHRALHIGAADPDRRSPVSLFSMPSRWLAIRSGNPYVVQAALRLHKATPCSWEEGLSVAQDRKL